MSKASQELLHFFLLNRWTTACHCRTTKCTFIVSGADKMDNEQRNKETVIMLCLISNQKALERCSEQKAISLLSSFGWYRHALERIPFRWKKIMELTGMAHRNVVKEELQFLRSSYHVTSQQRKWNLCQIPMFPFQMW
ncbi:hypothetical protein AOLI_G00241470 [Acnodon oligacanthus]